MYNRQFVKEPRVSKNNLLIDLFCILHKHITGLRKVYGLISSNKERKTNLLFILILNGKLYRYVAHFNGLEESNIN